MNDEPIINEAELKELYANGKHYDIQTITEMATKDGPGESRRRTVIDLGIGDSVDRRDSTKGKRIYGPCSVEVIFWPDGGIDMREYDLGQAPAMSKNTSDGKYIRPGAQKGRALGDGWDKTTYEWDGVSKTLSEWHRDDRRDPSVTLTLLRTRVKNSHWSVEKALTTPKAPRNRK